MNELKIFNNEEFGQIRAIEQDGEPWFVGKDVTDILGYKNPNEAIAEHVDIEDKLNSKTLSSCDLSLGQRGGWLINESGLYSLILSSKLPTAKKFKRWVTSEVIPSIRKHGAYLTDQKIEELLISPDTIINLATQIKEEREKKQGACRGCRAYEAERILCGCGECVRLQHSGRRSRKVHETEWRKHWPQPAV